MPSPSTRTVSGRSMLAHATDTPPTATHRKARPHFRPAHSDRSSDDITRPLPLKTSAHHSPPCHRAPTPKNLTTPLTIPLRPARPLGY